MELTNQPWVVISEGRPGLVTGPEGEIAVLLYNQRELAEMIAACRGLGVARIADLRNCVQKFLDNGVLFGAVDYADGQKIHLFDLKQILNNAQG